MDLSLLSAPHLVISFYFFLSFTKIKLGSDTLLVLSYGSSVCVKVKEETMYLRLYTHLKSYVNFMIFPISQIDCYHLLLITTNS